MVKTENLAPDTEYIQDDRQIIIAHKARVLLYEYEKYLKYKGLTDKEQEFFHELQTLHDNCYLNDEQKTTLEQKFMQFKINLINAIANCKKVYIAMGYRVKLLNKKTSVKS